MQKRYIIFILLMILCLCSLCACDSSKSDNNHTHFYTSITHNPTCTEKGYTVYSCSCGHTYIDNYVDAVGHNYISISQYPTCTEKGYTIHSCSCGDIYIDNYVDALGHSFTRYISLGNGTTEAICDRDGCNEKDSRTIITPSDPSPVDDADICNHISPSCQLVFPTCDRGGYEIYTCDCGATWEKDKSGVFPPLGHLFTNYVSDNNATYDNDGTKTAHCDRDGCNVTHTISDIGSKLERDILPSLIYFDRTEYSINKGDVFRITATIIPENANNKTISWVSSNPEVATVDSYGIVIGVSAGSTVITATTSNGVSTTAIVNVTRKIEYRTITLTKANYSDFVDVGCWLVGTKNVTTSVSYKESFLVYSNVNVSFNISIRGRYWSGGGYSGAQQSMSINRSDTGNKTSAIPLYAGYPFLGDSLTYSFTISGIVSGYFYVD